MKEYPITEETLDNIGVLQTSAASALAVGSLSLGFALSTWQALSLAGDTIPSDIKATWIAYQTAGLILTIGAYFVGLCFYWKKSTVLRKIKHETTHES